MVFLTINYLIFSLGGHWFFYHYLGPSITHREIVPSKPTKKQMDSEKRRSFQTQIIFFLLGLCLFILYKKGLTKIYIGWDERGVLYFFLSYLLLHHLHDAYFYWTHRLMHEWKFLRNFHFIHHESSPPTPFAALSFHPVEAFIHGIFWIILAVLLPMPLIWLFVFYSFMFYINMWGHTAYEFWHKDLFTHPILKVLNTPTHHILHHKYHQANYSIYYNFWDNVCGTNHPEYESHYKAVKAKTELEKTSKILKYMKL